MAASTSGLQVSFTGELKEPGQKAVLDGIIARGTYCEVYKGRMNEKLVAVKSVTIERAKVSFSWDDWTAISNETQRMKEIDHPNILKCLTSYVYNDKVCIVTPLMSYGSTSRLLQEYFPTGLPEVAVALIMRDIVNALVYLHERQYIHNGVKPSHILIGREGQAVLSGAGFMIQHEKGKDKVLKLKYLSIMTETVNWLSPEILSQNRDGFTNKADVYSLGLTCIMLATGVLPFGETSPSAMLIKKLNEAPPFLRQACGDGPAASASQDNGLDREISMQKEFSKEAQNFVSLCTLKEYVRPTSAELAKDKFLKTSHSSATVLKVLDQVKSLDAQSLGSSAQVMSSSNPLKTSSNEDCWDFEDLTR